MNAASPTTVPFEDYFLFETTSDEWSDGVVFAMSRGTPEYARLSMRIGRVLGSALGGEKFNAYRKLASFEEYVLVSQDEPLIEVYRRDPSGAWTVVEVARAGERATIHGAKIAVNDVYG